MVNLLKKKILLGISGGIAAYKTAELVRLLKKSGAEIKVVMTQAAQEFITPLTLQTISGNTVYTEMFNQHVPVSLEHISLARWADLVLIAPTTANIIAKLAHGIADDLLTTTCLATYAPLAIAPAMNCEMWHAQATQQNMHILRERRIHVLGPARGVQACGEVGYGRMLEPMQLVAELDDLLAQKTFLHGKHIIITAGATQEKIDSVRYLSNYSSGKMGYALAQAAQAAGANVTLISAPTHLSAAPPIKIRHVTTAQEMYDAVWQETNNDSAPRCDIFIAAAAVADYRPIVEHTQKLKCRHNNAKLTLELESTPDILAKVAALPPDKRPHVCVGFAAETENLIANATQKLHAKNLDMIVANYVGIDPKTHQMRGFFCDENEVTVLSKAGKLVQSVHLSLAPKIEIARKLIKIFSS